MADNHTSSTILKFTFIAGLAGALSALYFASRNGKEARNQLRSKLRSINLHELDTGPVNETMTAILREEQERMRLRRENKRQLPVLTNWEREL